MTPAAAAATTNPTKIHIVSFPSFAVMGVTPIAKALKQLTVSKAAIAHKLKMMPVILL